LALIPQGAHMTVNVMYGPPRAASEDQGWRIHRVVCDVCDEELQARRHSIAGGRTHATKRHVCATPGCYRISRVAHTSRFFCDVCDEGLHARGHSTTEPTHTA